MVGLAEGVAVTPVGVPVVGLTVVCVGDPKDVVLSRGTVCVYFA